MDQDTLDKLASGEYSISPRSGRLRKRVRLKKEKGFFHKSNVKKVISTFLWAILIAGFLLSLILVLPELNLTSTKKKPNSESSK
jgi:hypothetical protein